MIVCFTGSARKRRHQFRVQISGPQSFSNVGNYGRIDNQQLLILLMNGDQSSQLWFLQAKCSWPCGRSLQIGLVRGILCHRQSQGVSLFSLHSWRQFRESHFGWLVCSSGQKVGAGAAAQPSQWACCQVTWLIYTARPLEGLSYYVWCDKGNFSVYTCSAKSLLCR